MVVIFATKQSLHRIIIFALPGEIYLGITAWQAVYINICIHCMTCYYPQVHFPSKSKYYNYMRTLLSGENN